MRWGDDDAPFDPRENQEGWDAHVRNLLDVSDYDIRRYGLGELEHYLGSGYIDIENDTLYSSIHECELPLLCVAIELRAPLEVVSLLLDRGARIDTQTERCINVDDATGDCDLALITPMSIAIYHGIVEIVEVLLNRGVDSLTPTCWKCTMALSKDELLRTKPHDRPWRTFDAVRYAIDMGRPVCVSALVRHRRLSPHKLDLHIGYIRSELACPPTTSRATFAESLEIIEEARTLYARLDAAECALWVMTYAMRRRGTWRYLGPVVARHILADVVEADEEEGKESVSKKLKK
jgi:hypothetical protein